MSGGIEFFHRQAADERVDEVHAVDAEGRRVAVPRPQLLDALRDARLDGQVQSLAEERALVEAWVKRGVESEEAGE